MRVQGMWASRVPRSLIVVSLLGSGCIGTIGDDAHQDPEVGEAACDLTPGRVGLQRLTHDEYDRTVRDLFGVTSAPAASFPPDSATSGFDNNAKSLTISPLLAELLFDAAEDVAAEAMLAKKDEIIACDPQAGWDECGRTTLEALALRVYRRPPTTAEVDDLMKLMDFAQTEGDTFELGIEYALQAMLVAPQFLYRGIPADDSAPLSAGQIVALDDYALVSRLSYLLWGSTPDDELLARAGDGSLRDSEALRAEFDRMLADPKSAALFESFVMQWLQLGKLGAATPDPQAFPEFTEELRTAMLEEARLFFEDIRARDASALEFINGTSTFANQAIADIYGVSGVSGSELQSIATDPAQRAGVLTMPAILTMTSGPTSPNIVKRGVWLAETILCASPPPPPEGVPPQPDPQPGETERERLARHRLDPSCASCHDLIDPLGFAFESYDAIGQWREMADGVPVDNLGKLPDGSDFKGIPGLARLLEVGHEYKTCVTSKLMTYALGRTFEPAEACLHAAIGAETITPDSKLSDFLWAVVTSDAFLKEETAGGQ